MPCRSPSARGLSFIVAKHRTGRAAFRLDAMKIGNRLRIPASNTPTKGAGMLRTFLWLFLLGLTFSRVGAEERPRVLETSGPDPMRFEWHKGAAENCRGACRGWISAEGKSQR